MRGSTENNEKAIFAAGCFWGVQHFFQNVHGVVATTAGYTGGHRQSPTYREVCTGNTGHAEAVKVLYHSAETSFEVLVKLFFEMHNPSLITHTCGKRSQYRSAIFYIGEEQKAVAERLAEQLRNKNVVVGTGITPAGVFYKAEDYHQGYYARQGRVDPGRSCTARF